MTCALLSEGTELTKSHKSCATVIIIFMSSFFPPPPPPPPPPFNDVASKEAPPLPAAFARERATAGEAVWRQLSYQFAWVCVSQVGVTTLCGVFTA